MKNTQEGKYINIMKEFTLKNIPDLDVCVMAALELLSKTKIPQINVRYKRPLVTGSGNAFVTGEILFNDKDAIFADESTFKKKLKKIKTIDGVVIVSASGGKHAPIIAKESKKRKKNITLITNNRFAESKAILTEKDKVYVFPKNREPYTYNTSTYLSMIFGKTGENPRSIMRFIKQRIDKIKLPDFSKYNRFYILIPDELEESKRMLQVKFIELFGRRIARDIETFSYSKHATTVVPSSNELFINFGKKTGLGKDRLFIPLPRDATYGALISIGYYIIGKIQKAYPPWFKRNIKKYTEEASKVFNENIPPIVE